MAFTSLGISEALQKTAASLGYTDAYPIQQQAIPAILAGRDVLALAQTGSGKTAGFVLPILERLSGQAPVADRRPRVLVLVPTRELAGQVGEVFKSLSAGLPRRIKIGMVFGGVSINPQMMRLHGTDVLVATPGRLLDLLERKALQLSGVEVLVLDEADKMLNLGFRDEMKQLLALLPGRQQNLLFSATMDGELQAITERLLRNPLRIEIAPEGSTPDQIRQLAYRVSAERKGPFLRYLIKEHKLQQVLVFVSSVRTADNLSAKLIKNGIPALPLHSQKSQGARTEALRRFKQGKLQVLVATDLASRGIDILELPHVINYDLPRSPKDYVHRIGRTGRAAATGEAISLITPEDEHHFGVIQKKMGRTVALLESEGINLHGV
ncbi:DEAD/DEAH box helicase [Cesiribacter andamanensis]|nr:DEAD/DEAH box helicase [Cesiribacter andamanensis]